jgi:uncharacterized membrane protein
MRIIKALFKFYFAGLSETVILVVLTVAITFVADAGKPIGGFLASFIPADYLFPKIELIILFVAFPIIFHTLAKIGVGKLLRKTFGRVPVLNFFFREKIVQEGIPVMARFANGNTYGFLRGRTKVVDDTGFAKGKELWAVFVPSSPMPATSVFLIDFDPEDIREIEVIGKEGRNNARTAIISKCLNFGEALPPIRLKKIEDAEKLPNIAPKEGKKISFKKKGIKFHQSAGF